MKTKEIIHSIISNAVTQAITDGVFPKEMASDNYKVEYPKEEKFGDYATPIAMTSARILRRNPMEIGEILKQYIEKSEYVHTVAVAKPGFVNMFLAPDYLYRNLATILSEKDDYGKSTKEHPQKINIEFVSANPTGPMNIVSARAAALGDCIGNLLEMDGDIVEREFYVNDYGNQVYLLGKSVKARIEELEGKDTSFPEDGYQGEYVKDIAKSIIKNHKSEIDAIDDEDELINYLAVKAVEHNVNGQQKDLERFNVIFKTWFRERTLHENNQVLKTLEFLERHNSIYEDDGKKFFRSTDYGDDKDRVVVRDDGRPTYLLADIAYHKNKIDREYDKIIDIWGPDHHGYIARLSGAMQALDYPKENFQVLIAQQVNLIMEGETVKMSKRLGKFSTMHDLIEEIGVDVARYFFVMRSLESHLDFDLALAKKNSSENPVFYLQYAHARICSIFKKAAEKGINYCPGQSLLTHLDNPEAIVLMKLLLKFPEEISDAAQNYEPHRITNFLMRLAKEFHRFYTEHKILSEDETCTNSYLKLAEAVRIVMKNGLHVLGIDAPERM